MKTQLLFFMLFLNINFGSYSQNKIKKNKAETKDYIIWTTYRKLNWQDFKSKEKRKNIGVAQTGASIEIKPFRNKNKKYDYKVLSKFYKNKSWTQTKSLSILKHEQLHFDIAELYARKMRKEIALVKSDRKIVKESDYRRIHRKFFKEYLAFQNKYDLETEYSLSTKIQKKWEGFILVELEKLADYTLKI
ncbi:hypothetical protein BTO04_01985 [Polaribacter sp. SA4-10]|uniref:DUF922 domain-containing protein n=1 Tax=Polaribacter sp. SA4-10 TaxID=754397 RepID=UPI000B3C95A4|nr:hypothetical protein [Polaribacter sp. SA4-10]ARV05540.1 hypothetical protein BTO04_01985 [Polaribacter sp. SA4-10]